MPLRKFEHVDAGDAVLITRTFRQPLGESGDVNPQTMIVYRVLNGVVVDEYTPELSYSDSDTAVTAKAVVEFPTDSPSGTQFVIFTLTAPIIATEIVEFAVRALPALPD